MGESLDRCIPPFGPWNGACDNDGRCGGPRIRIHPHLSLMINQHILVNKDVSDPGNHSNDLSMRSGRLDSDDEVGLGVRVANTHVVMRESASSRSVPLGCCVEPFATALALRFDPSFLIINRSVRL